MQIGSFDIITPVHSPKSNLPGDLQNTLLVGSNSLGDSRLLPAQTVKPLSNWAQAVGVTANPTTTSTAFVPAVDMAVTLKTNGNPIEITYYSDIANNVVGAFATLNAYVDGVPAGPGQISFTPISGYQFTCGESLIVPVAAGQHTVQVFWKVSAGAGTLGSAQRLLKVREL